MILRLGLAAAMLVTICAPSADATVCTSQAASSTNPVVVVAASACVVSPPCGGAAAEVAVLVYIPPTIVFQYQCI
jgi:hypothetical protein